MIEQDFARIAAALERIANHLEGHNNRPSSPRLSSWPRSRPPSSRLRRRPVVARARSRRVERRDAVESRSR